MGVREIYREVSDECAERGGISRGAIRAVIDHAAASCRPNTSARPAGGITGSGAVSVVLQPYRCEIAT